MNKFVTNEYDKFKEKSTTTSLNWYFFANKEKNTDISKFKCYWKIQLRQVVTKQLNNIVFDLEYASDDWFFLKDGCIIFNIDDTENIELQPIIDNSEVRTAGQVYEYISYVPTVEQFSKICSAKNLSIKVSGAKYYEIFESELAIGFVNFCRQFYNAVIDSEMYVESLNSSYTGKSSNCFIATAVFSDYNHPYVLELRAFRDMWLLERNWGKNFVKFYYINSGYVISIIQKHYHFKKVFYYLLIRPVLGLSRFLIKQ